MSGFGNSASGGTQVNGEVSGFLNTGHQNADPFFDGGAVTGYFNAESFLSGLLDLRNLL
jgi:hypothetical protein